MAQGCFLRRGVFWLLVLALVTPFLLVGGGPPDTRRSADRAPDAGQPPMVPVPPTPATPPTGTPPPPAPAVRPPSPSVRPPSALPTRNGGGESAPEGSPSSGDVTAATGSPPSSSPTAADSSPEVPATAVASPSSSPPPVESAATPAPSLQSPPSSSTSPEPPRLSPRSSSASLSLEASSPSGSPSENARSPGRRVSPRGLSPPVLSSSSLTGPSAGDSPLSTSLHGDQPHGVVPLSVYATDEQDRQRLLAMSEWERERELGERYEAAVRVVQRVSLLRAGGEGLTPLQQHIMDRRLTSSTSQSPTSAGGSPRGGRRGRGAGRRGGAPSRRGRGAARGASSPTPSDSLRAPTRPLGRWDDEEEEAAEEERLRAERTAHSQTLESFFEERGRRVVVAEAAEEWSVRVEVSPQGQSRAASPSAVLPLPAVESQVAEGAEAFEEPASGEEEEGLPSPTAPDTPPASETSRPVSSPTPAIASLPYSPTRPSAAPTPPSATRSLSRAASGEETVQARG